jgi:hypothetical protein
MYYVSLLFHRRRRLSRYFPRHRIASGLFGVGIQLQPKGLGDKLANVQLFTRERIDGLVLDQIRGPTLVVPKNVGLLDRRLQIENIRQVVDRFVFVEHIVLGLFFGVDVLLFLLLAACFRGGFLLLLLQKEPAQVLVVVARYGLDHRVNWKFHVDLEFLVRPDTRLGEVGLDSPLRLDRELSAGTRGRRHGFRGRPERKLRFQSRESLEIEPFRQGLALLGIGLHADLVVSLVVGPGLGRSSPMLKDPIDVQDAGKLVLGKGRIGSAAACAAAAAGARRRRRRRAAAQEILVRTRKQGNIADSYPTSMFVFVVTEIRRERTKSAGTCDQH